MIIPAMRTWRRCGRPFAFTGYWLNNPPGATVNTWRGKRKTIEAMGYGFLLLFNRREYSQLKASGNAARVGSSDAAAAVKSATHEGFPKGSILFLDQEQGGRMLPEQRAYIHAWVGGVVRGGYRAGVYCSGIAFHELATASVVTADDIRDHAGSREIHFFVANDQCGPIAGLRLSEAGANARCQRRVLRRRLAIRAIPAASGHDCGVPSNLCGGWQLLSASHAGQLRGVC